MSSIEELRFIFTTPSYVKQKSELQREFYITQKQTENPLSGNEFEIKLKNKLTQSAIAKECAAWLRQKVRVKSYRKPNPAQLRMVIAKNTKAEDDIAIHGGVDFTSDGLGITPSSRIDSDYCFYVYGREIENRFPAS